MINAVNATATAGAAHPCTNLATATPITDANSCERRRFRGWARGERGVRKSSIAAAPWV
jgi:hypothetical protein